MRAAAMSLTAALSGFVVLLSVSVVHNQDGWAVTYTPTHICAAEGSTVDLNCNYTYPADQKIQVLNIFWFIKGPYTEPVNLTRDSDYTGRVTYLCADKVCNLRITELRRNDSAVYKFRFVTNQTGGKFTGEPGVTLSVTALSVQVIKAASYPHYNRVDLKCHSSCDRPTYVWFKNGLKIPGQTSNISVYVHGADSFSCAVIGHEKFPSPSVYPPKVPSVSVSPSAEIVEGSSVNLTCSSDSNPAANYTWYKENEDSIKTSGQIFTITDIRPEHSGNYSCEAQNTIGRENSTLQLVVVAESGISTAAGVTAAGLLLLLMLLCVYVWVRKMRANKEPPEPEENPDNREQRRNRGQSEEQENLQYTTVRFSSAHMDPIYCNIRAAQPHTHEEEQEVTEYSVVRLNSDRTSPGSS